RVDEDVGGGSLAQFSLRREEAREAHRVAEAPITRVAFHLLLHPLVLATHHQSRLRMSRSETFEDLHRHEGVVHGMEGAHPEKTRCEHAPKAGGVETDVDHVRNDPATKAVWFDGSGEKRRWSDDRVRPPQDAAVPAWEGRHELRHRSAVQHHDDPVAGAAPDPAGDVLHDKT